jgi:hypothetical protein
MPIREYDGDELVDGDVYRVNYYDNSNNLNMLIHSSLARYCGSNFNIILSFTVVKCDKYGKKPFKFFDTPKNQRRRTCHHWRFFETGENITDRVLRNQAIELEFGKFLDPVTANCLGDGWFKK